MSIINKFKVNIKLVLRDVIINSIASSMLVLPHFRYLIYRMYGIDTNSHLIRPKCIFLGKNIYIGRGTFVNYGCLFDNSAKITIGDNCDIAFNTKFITSSHKIGSPSRRAGIAYGKPISVGNGVWIGANVTILPGVNVEDGCIIAAGSVVSKDCDSNSLYAGIPARKVKDLPL